MRVTNHKSLHNSSSLDEKIMWE